MKQMSRDLFQSTYTAYMTQHNFIIPKTARSASKADQMEALNVVRSHYIQSHGRGFISHQAIAQQVKESLASSGMMVPRHVNTASVHNTGVYASFATGPSMRTLTNNDINTYSYDGHIGVAAPNQAQTSASVLNYKSQTEQAFMNYNASHNNWINGDLGLPEGWQQ